MADGKDPPTRKSPFSVSAFREFVEKTPCARNAFLYGVVGGMVAGGSVFMYSRHVRRSCDLAVASFALVSMGSWQLCRYTNWKNKQEIDKTVELLTKYSNAKERDNDHPKVT